MSRLISLVNFHEIALQSIWWRDIPKNPLFEPLQAKFQPERMYSSRLVIIWSEIGAQKSALPSRQRAVPSTVAITKLRIGLWIDSSSTLFSGFGPVWLLLSVPKLKNLARGKKFSSNDYQTWTMRPFWLKFGLKEFKEWIFRDVASSNGL